MIRAVLLLSCFILASFSLKGQINHETYKKVNIDSLLKSPVTLPKEGYSITNIQFTANYNKDLGSISGVHRDRFLQFQDQHPELMWQFSYDAVKFKIGDTSLYIPLGEDKRRLYRLVWDSWGDRLGPKVILYAQMLVGKFQRYGVTRDLIIRDMVIAPKE